MSFFSSIPAPCVSLWERYGRSVKEDLKFSPNNLEINGHTWANTCLNFALLRLSSCAGTTRFSVSSRSNADDRFPGAPFGRVEGGDGIVDRRDLPDVRPQSSI